MHLFFRGGGATLLIFLINVTYITEISLHLTLSNQKNNIVKRLKLLLGISLIQLSR